MVISSDLERVYEIGPVFRAENSKSVDPATFSVTRKLTFNCLTVRIAT